MEPTGFEEIERLRAVVSGAPVLLFFTDRDGICTLCGGRGRRIGEHRGFDVGYPASDLLGEGPLMLLPGGVAMTGAETVERALRGDAVEAETRAGGVVFDVRLRPHVDEWSRDVVGVIGVIADSGARPREDVLVARIAHEINNPLTYTLLGAELMLGRVRAFAGRDPSPEAIAELLAALPSFVDSLAQSLHGLERIRQVVRNLMTSSRARQTGRVCSSTRSSRDPELRSRSHT